MKVNIYVQSHGSPMPHIHMADYQLDRQNIIESESLCAIKWVSYAPYIQMADYQLDRQNETFANTHSFTHIVREGILKQIKR